MLLEHLKFAHKHILVEVNLEEDKLRTRVSYIKPRKNLDGTYRKYSKHIEIYRMGNALLV
jgi:hypothetical protein